MLQNYSWRGGECYPLPPQILAPCTFVFRYSVIRKVGDYNLSIELKNLTSKFGVAPSPICGDGRVSYMHIAWLPHNVEFPSCKKYPIDSTSWFLNFTARGLSGSPRGFTRFLHHPLQNGHCILCLCRTGPHFPHSIKRECEYSCR